LYGTFVWARRALNDPKRRFPARAVFFFSGFLAFYSMLTSILTQQMQTAQEFVVRSAKWTWAVTTDQ
jgi:hypothetical protein